MSELPVDLRSDTVTRPSAAMRQAMAQAEVGDDVYGEDPTINRLEERAAEVFGREASLFLPSGSMGNLICLKLQTRPGTEVICEQKAHINQYEMASMAAIAGAFPRPIPTANGILSWEQIEGQIRPKSYYMSQTALVSLENTHNMAGGTLYPPAVAEEICERAHGAGLRVHLDGARIFNAAAAQGQSVARLSAKFDSVMFSLSKGLGAPVGSMIAGSREFIGRARSARKMLGGGMRQAGILAAAGLLALEEGPARLAEDHRNARRLAVSLAELPGVTLDPEAVVTNIVIFGVEKSGKTAAEVCAELKVGGILASGVEKYAVRMVTHLDVDRGGIERAIAVASRVLGSR
jgi:threonine aldolase